MIVMMFQSVEDGQSEEHEDIRLGRLREILLSDAVPQPGSEEDDLCEGAGPDMAGHALCCRQTPVTQNGPIAEGPGVCADLPDELLASVGESPRYDGLSTIQREQPGGSDPPERRQIEGEFRVVHQYYRENIR